jgi:hypothetical protein
MWQIRLGAGIGVVAVLLLYGLAGLTSIEPGDVYFYLANPAPGIPMTQDLDQILETTNDKR